MDWMWISSVGDFGSRLGGGQFSAAGDGD